MLFIFTLPFHFLQTSQYLYILLILIPRIIPDHIAQGVLAQIITKSFIKIVDSDPPWYDKWIMPHNTHKLLAVV
ncbi:hypothetical protein SHM_12020 [Spiroplasma ixodetis]|uniref:Secreted protein n=1 Tax=Spiroplasma ixodetis TaxID=2141 RepID=A0ABN6SWV1_9MOLU|nr:hypothetical protein SHM_12020 [Spiroplasma ixodetis]